MPEVQGSHVEQVCDLNDIQITLVRNTIDSRYITTIQNNCHTAGCAPTNIRLSCDDYNPRNKVPPYLIRRRDGNVGACIINDGLSLSGSIEFAYQQDEPASFFPINADYPCCPVYS